MRFTVLQFTRYYSYLLVSLFIAVFSNAYGQADCSINAGGDAIICGSSTTLTGATSGSLGPGGPMWTFVSGPVTPTIISPASLSTEVTGMTEDGDYIFKISHACVTGTAESEVRITAHPRPATFTAGADVTNVLATVGTVNLSDAVIPEGFTGSWSAYNIYSRNRFNTTVSTNSTFSDPDIANPDFSLIKKADHDIDPAYVLTLTITSLDGVCSYEDTKVVRFIPHTDIQLVLDNGGCINPPGDDRSHFVPFQSAGPHFNTVIAGTAANPDYGTTVTLAVVDQPVGGNLGFAGIQENSRAVLSGITVTGEYVFTLTVTNASGSFTTLPITYTFDGLSPYPSLFNLSAHPEQMTDYNHVNSGGEFHSSAKIGSTDAETFYFDINPLNPVNTITTVAQTGVFPPGGGVGTITVDGAGTVNRTATIAAPAGGWQVGTYRFTVTNQAVGGCASTQFYYIHVSDSDRPDVAVSDVTVCYPGTGAISATIQLPEVYKGAVNSSYFQDFEGRYHFTLLSSPDGAATPTYTSNDLRSLTSTSTVIGNLNKAGDYRFRITAVKLNNNIGEFLAAEYASSGTSLTSEFTIRVENRVNSNAGSDQTVLCPTTVTLIGNATGPSSGEWSVISSPASTTPTFTDPTSPLTSVTGLTEEGEYEFAWTITSPLGGCVSTDVVKITRVCSGTTITIPGNIWIDANGDAITDVGEGGIANGLWANLLDPSGEVITSVAIQPDGSYSFEVPTNLLTETGTYSIALTNDVKSAGTLITEADIPLNNYLYTGTNRGNATSADPVNHTGVSTIGDLSTVIPGSTLEPVNFGIQRPPVADPKSYNVSNSAFSTAPPVGYPAEPGFQSIPASSSSLTGITGGSLSGSDPEDCSIPSTCNTGTGTTFNIESVNNNTKLFYDSGAGPVEIVVPTGSSVSIPDFDVDKLVIYGANGGGTDDDLFGFTYSMTDKAGITSPAVSYTIETETTLPVTLVNFTAAVIKGEVSEFARLKWETTDEMNSDKFEVQRSANGVQWKSVGVVLANGESTRLITYDFDDQDNLYHESFYRLKSIDKDGTFTFSHIRAVQFSEHAITGITVYPNPSADKVLLDGVNISKIKSIEILDQNGRNVLKKDAPSSNKIDVSMLPVGLYFVKILLADGRVEIKKISVSK